MKTSRAETRATFHTLPEIRFEEQRLTAFGGLVVVQALFDRLEWKRRIERCFAHRTRGKIFGPHIILTFLVVHLMLGFRRLRDRDYYHEDPLVHRLLGLRRLPDVSTISRSLRDADERSVKKVARFQRELVLERLQKEGLARVTLDFDGSVLSTRGHAEGSAVGFNPKRKGARSYYPLFCTVAQTEQFLDLLHRPGNVHDSRGAREFLLSSVGHVRRVLPRARIESRLDGAFFDQQILLALDDQRVEFTASVPFERLAELKGMIERRRHWKEIDREWAYFELSWKPKSWPKKLRFLLVRHLVAPRQKGPVQLDLFEPVDPSAEYTVIVTNKRGSAKTILRFHHGRGSQEATFGEAKSHAALDYVPVRTLCGNQLFSLAALLAHNLGKELQIQASERRWTTSATRASLWPFTSLRTLRHRFLLRAGRLTRPQNRLTLTLNANPAVQSGLLQLLGPQTA